MKVKHLIEKLKKNYNPEDSLIVFTRDREDFAPLLDKDDDWATISQSCMDEMDWADMTQDIIDYIEDFQWAQGASGIFGDRLNKQGDA